MVGRAARQDRRAHPVDDLGLLRRGSTGEVIGEVPGQAAAFRQRHAGKSLPGHRPPLPKAGSQRSGRQAIPRFNQIDGSQAGGGLRRLGVPTPRGERGAVDLGPLVDQSPVEHPRALSMPFHFCIERGSEPLRRRRFVPQGGRMLDERFWGSSAPSARFGGRGLFGGESRGDIRHGVSSIRRRVDDR